MTHRPVRASLVLTLACTVGVLSAATTKTAATPPSLRERVEALIQASGAEVAVAMGTIDGRESLLLNADTVFHAASTMKVPVMVELFRQAGTGAPGLDDRITVVNRFTSVVDGSPYALEVGDDSDADIYKAIGAQRSYRELCEAMITVSSNLATNVLIEQLGAGRVSETMRRYGAEGMLVRRGVEDNKAFEKGLNNTATARGFYTILMAIARREAVSPDASAAMIEILKRQTFRNGIPAGVPPGTAVAHKTGTITKVHHDGGIVFAPRPYVLAVMTRGFADEKTSDTLIAGISKLVYEHLNIEPERTAGRIMVTDFGAAPGSRTNAVPAVQRALDAARGVDHPVLVFPKGRYDFWPQHSVERTYFESNTTANNPKRLAILIDRFHDLTIDGGGSTFVFHDRIQPFTIDTSSGVTIRNVSIDWDIPLTAEAVVDAVTDEYLDVRIDDRQFPYIIEDGHLVFVGEGWKSAWRSAMEFDGQTLQVVPGTGDAGCLGPDWRNHRAEALERGLVRLHRRFGRRPAPGNILVMRHSERDHAGLFVVDSKDVTVEDVNLYHCAGLGLLAQFTENLTVRRFQAVPSPARRVVSGHDDGVQVSNGRGLVLIEGSRFHGLMDDPINVHGTSVRIVAQPAPDRLTCRFMHDQSTGMTWGRTGDRVGFIEHQSMRTVAEGALTAFRAIDRDTFEVALDRPVPAGIVPGDALENLTWAPDVTIRDNAFESNRARGVLVSTPGRVLIERNRFQSSGAAILIAGDANQWYESGAVRDVTIRDNVFEASCLSSPYQFSEGVISIYPEIPAPQAAFPFHRNIRIERNVFSPSDYPVLYAKSVDGITFSDNRIERGRQFEPFHSRKATLTFEWCRRVRVERNQVAPDVLGRNIVVKDMPAGEVVVGPDQAWIR